MKNAANKGRDFSGKRSFRYTFRMSAAENIRFQKMLSEADCEKNISRFILARLFGWEFKVVRVNDSAVRFYKRLNNFYYQFQAIGNNYNQVVHAINRGFTEQSARLLLARLVEQTRDLKRLSEQILALAKEFNERFNADGSENNIG